MRRSWPPVPTRATYAARCPSAKAFDDALLAYEMNGQRRCRRITASRCGSSCRAGSASRASSGSARSRSPTPRCTRTGTRGSTAWSAPTTRRIRRRSRASRSRAPSSCRGRRPVQSGRTVTLHGRSWSGSKPIQQVDVRVTGAGRAGDWRRAHLHGPNLPHAWVRWNARLAAARARRIRAARPGDRPRRHRAAGDGPLQRRRLPVLGGRPPSRHRRGLPEQTRRKASMSVTDELLDNAKTLRRRPSTRATSRCRRPRRSRSSPAWTLGSSRLAFSGSKRATRT